ncbi:MaoC/PaaZ C-terminal domain-containing protein [Denitromonas ohlonensis]|uniref:MaoC-like domain-containing protein n=2 Tax=Denitromonas TaxID=139331 RepID=A0A558EB49_9RHOO|nr:MaoC/PaaZ C-terminal domain-containing protein [Denitromonas ohlonensis]TVT48690.1 MAG: hypothetical protein FHP94_09295 [Denitromonas halophila]TVO63559.1 hypothetical protein FHP90_13855 [Denitromonas ohlonensis]TVO75436.1 hypothetical protein FHP89_13890 [Denitromonas ohlonensis]TVT70565.1 MAG: hypothetical protein FHP92_17720 [Denitromonas halophila]TVT75687.1 MAG: hypothetical protein FHP93_00345 [Denitromonas halophila]
MSIDLASVALGDVVATAEGPPFDAQALARYAQASGDLNPLHTDRAFAAKAGFPDLVVHGMLNMARLGRLVTAHFPAQQILSFSVRFEGVLLAGQATTMAMTLSARSEGGAEFELQMRTSGDQRIASGVVKVSTFL